MVDKYDEDDEYQHLTPLFWRLADPATPEHGKRRLRDILGDRALALLAKFGKLPEGA